MLRIRFLRVGRKGHPFYKIVVTDKNNPPSSGRFVDEVGFYNPLTKEFRADKERINYWTEKGAQFSDVVFNLLVKKGVIKGEKRNVFFLSKKRREKISAAEKGEEKKEIKEETVKEEVKEEKEKRDTGEEEKKEEKKEAEPKEEAGEEEKKEEKKEAEPKEEAGEEEKKEEKKEEEEADSKETKETEEKKEK